MWCEEIFLWIRKISNDWLKAWWNSIRYPLSIAESSSQKNIFLIVDQRKFYKVSTSVADSPIQKEIFIIAERRKFFQVFYCGFAMPRTQNYECWTWGWKVFFPSRLFIKKLSKKQIAKICLNTFFLITIAAAAVQLKILLSWRLPFFKGLFWTCKTVLILNSNEFYYFFISAPLLCLLFSAQIFFGDYCPELTVQSFDWTLKCNNFSSICFLFFSVNSICMFYFFFYL